MLVSYVSGIVILLIHFNKAYGFCFLFLGTRYIYFVVLSKQFDADNFFTVRHDVSFIFTLASLRLL